jgi:hypothetical protein
MTRLSLRTIAATAQTEGDFTFPLNETTATLTGYTGSQRTATITVGGGGGNAP